MYDEEGNKYPINYQGQLYVQLGLEQTIAEGAQEEKDENTKNLKGPMLVWLLLEPLDAQLAQNR